MEFDRCSKIKLASKRKRVLRGSRVFRARRSRANGGPRRKEWERAHRPSGIREAIRSSPQRSSPAPGRCRRAKNRYRFVGLHYCACFRPPRCLSRTASFHDMSHRPRTCLGSAGRGRFSHVRVYLILCFFIFTFVSCVSCSEHHARSRHPG